MRVSICMCVLFFFFKQKTAYELRISDWSSDVCSSDLGRPPRSRRARVRPRTTAPDRPAPWLASVPEFPPSAVQEGNQSSFLPGTGRWTVRRTVEGGGGKRNDAFDDGICIRSEEHTSELQSLMRISYAVFCLKKKI